MTSAEYDRIVAEVRHDRALEDVIRRGEAAQAASMHPDDEISDLEWSPV